MTWKAHEKHGELTERSDLPDSVFAFPGERKNPLTDAQHVRSAIARSPSTLRIGNRAFGRTRLGSTLGAAVSLPALVSASTDSLSCSSGPPLEILQRLFSSNPSWD